MIPLPLVKRAAALMSDDDAVSQMFLTIVEYEENPLLHQNENMPLDPRLFNAHTLDRVARRAKLSGDDELSEFMFRLAKERETYDAEQVLVEEAKAAGRAITYKAAGEIFRALGLKTDAEVLSLRIQGYRLSPILGQPMFALLRESPLSLVQA